MIKIYLAKRQFNLEKSAFFEDLASVLVQGVSFTDCLNMKIKFNAGKKVNFVYKTILSRFSSAESISNSFMGFLNNTEIQALKGWDNASSDKNLAEGFSIVSKLTKAFDIINKAVKMTLTKALTASLLVFIIYYLMRNNIFPSIMTNFPIELWSALTYWTYTIINFFFSNLFVLIIGIVLFIALYTWSLENWSSPIRRYLDNTLLYSWYKSYRSLSVLLFIALKMKSSLDINQALREATSEAGSWETWYLIEILKKNNSAVKGGEIFDVGFFDTHIIQRILMLSIGGSTEKALDVIAFQYQSELLGGFKTRIDNTGNNIKNTMLVLGAFPVCVFFTTVSDMILSIVK